LADDKTPWVEIDMKEEIAIGAFSVSEPWHPWDNKGQKIALQYKKGEKWENAAEVTTNGTGHTMSIKPVKARYFRISIIESKDPTLNEWILFRAD
jgi:hypothetical protein